MDHVATDGEVRQPGIYRLGGGHVLDAGRTVFWRETPRTVAAISIAGTAVEPGDRARPATHSGVLFWVVLPFAETARGSGRSGCGGAAGGTWHPEQPG